LHCSTTIAMPQIELCDTGDTDLRAPEFPSIHARLARDIIEHKADLGPAAQAASDEALLARADDIVWLLITSIARADAIGDQRFPDRYRWLMKIYEDLLHGRDGKPLDG
jgi:hypothetical protein